MNQVSGVLELGLLLSSLVALLATFWSQNTGPISWEPYHICFFSLAHLCMYSCMVDMVDMVDMVITMKTAIMVVMKKNKIYKRAHPTKMINLIKENPYE